MCEACHGAGGSKPVIPAYPVIGGQYANYLERALLDYKSGARKNPIMLAQVATLSAAEIKALAKHFGDLQGPLYTPTLP
jgi:cytochrome c553